MRRDRSFAMTIDPPAPAHLCGRLDAFMPIAWRRERVEWIARRRVEGWTMDEIGAALGIRQQSVSAIVRRWRLDAWAQQHEPGGRSGEDRGATLPAGPGCRPAKGLPSLSAVPGASAPGTTREVG